MASKQRTVPLWWTAVLIIAVIVVFVLAVGIVLVITAGPVKHVLKELVQMTVLGMVLVDRQASVCVKLDGQWLTALKSLVIVRAQQGSRSARFPISVQEMDFATMVPAFAMCSMKVQTALCLFARIYAQVTVPVIQQLVNVLALRTGVLLTALSRSARSTMGWSAVVLSEACALLKEMD